MQKARKPLYFKHFRGALCVASRATRLAVLALLTIVTVARAQSPSAQRFVSDQFKFELSYPAGFAQVPDTVAGAPLVLRSQGADYPTFNVLVETAGPRLTLAERGQRVLSDYRKVGLTDSTLVSAREVPAGRLTGEEFVLHYNSAGHEFISTVTLVATAHYSYIMTVIARPEQLEEAKSLLDEVRGSFESKDEEVRHAAPSSGLHPYFLAVLGLTFLSALAFLIRRRIMPS